MVCVRLVPHFLFEEGRVDAKKRAQCDFLTNLNWIGAQLWEGPNWLNGPRNEEGSFLEKSFTTGKVVFEARAKDDGPSWGCSSVVFPHLAFLPPWFLFFFFFSYFSFQVWEKCRRDWETLFVFASWSSSLASLPRDPERTAGQPPDGAGRLLGACRAREGFPFYSRLVFSSSLPLFLRILLFVGSRPATRRPASFFHFRDLPLARGFGEAEEAEAASALETW